VEIMTDAVRRRAVDPDQIRTAVRLLLQGLGEDPDREGLRDTPDRVARFYTEWLAPVDVQPDDWLARQFTVDHDDVVLVRDIRFHSLCEHHLLPFFGVAHIAYKPHASRVTGLSKLARLVDHVAGQPQVQERLTQMLAEAVDTALKPAGVFVMVQAEHLCMTMRGVKKSGASTVTTAARGIYQQSPERDLLWRWLTDGGPIARG